MGMCVYVYTHVHTANNINWHIVYMHPVIMQDANCITVVEMQHCIALQIACARPVPFGKKKP